MQETIDKIFIDGDLELDEFYTMYGSYFHQHAWHDIKEKMQGLNSDKLQQLKQPGLFLNPKTMVWAAFPFGILGVDRFILGEVGLGLVKLFTAGQFLVGFLVDSFSIVNRTKTYNYNRFLEIVTGINLT